MSKTIVSAVVVLLAMMPIVCNGQESWSRRVGVTLGLGVANAYTHGYYSINEGNTVYSVGLLYSQERGLLDLETHLSLQKFWLDDDFRFTYLKLNPLIGIRGRATTHLSLTAGPYAVAVLSSQVSTWLPWGAGHWVKSGTASKFNYGISGALGLHHGKRRIILSHSFVMAYDLGTAFTKDYHVLKAYMNYYEFSIAWNFSSTDIEE